VIVALDAPGEVGLREGSKWPLFSENSLLSIGSRASVLSIGSIESLTSASSIFSAGLGVLSIGVSGARLRPSCPSAPGAP
jgi:hypothetical protein